MLNNTIPVKTIPKQIHYCWFGSQEKNALILSCIESWKQILPDYEIKEWNESNSIFDCDFARKALALEKWAFLSDYVRLRVLLDFGGIYLDTDMLFIKSMDEILNESCFLGYQHNGEIAAGIIGATPNHPFIKHCVDIYKGLKFDESRLMNMAIPKLLTEAYKNYSNRANVVIYSYDYFYPYLFKDSLLAKDYKPSIKGTTIAVHMWNASWFTEKELAGFAFEQKKYFKGIRLFTLYFLRNPGKATSIPLILFRFLKRERNEN